METAFGTKNVCRVVWGDSGEEPLPTRFATGAARGLKLIHIPPRHSNVTIALHPYWRGNIRVWPHQQLNKFALYPS